MALALVFGARGLLLVIGVLLELTSSGSGRPLQ